jgi:hypothetical protein
MATARSRTAVTSNVPLQSLTPSSSQSGAQIAAHQGTTHQPAIVQVPVTTHPSTPSTIQGTLPTSTSQPIAPPASQTAAPQTQQVTGCPSTVSSATVASPTVSTTPPSASGSPPIPGPLSINPVAASPSLTGPTSTIKSSWEKRVERLNSPVGWITVILALVFGIFAYKIGIKALVLQVWSAHNDQRDSCWTDWDHGIYSRACNETLARPATPPPFKRVVASQKGSVSRYASYWTLLPKSISSIYAMISLMYFYPGIRKTPSPTLPNQGTQTLRRRVFSEVTCCEYHHGIKTTSPFLRRSRLLLVLKVCIVLLPISSGFLLPFLPIYSIYSMCFVSLAFFALLCRWSGSSISDDYKKWMYVYQGQTFCVKV